MSTACKSHIVHGYIRYHCIHSIPETIIRICLLYYEEISVVRFKGKTLKKFQSMKNKEAFKRGIEFNKDLSLRIEIAPNGWCESEVEQTCIGLGIDGDMSKHIESFRINCIWGCIETESSINYSIE